MTSRAEQAFFNDLEKLSATPAVGTRRRPKWMIPDEGIIQQQKATTRVNRGALVTDYASDTQDLKDKRTKQTQPGQPESTWRADKVAEDRQFLLEPDVCPIVYANEMSQKYGRDWLAWEPETLWETIRKDWSTYPNEEAKNKLMAIKVVMANESFWHEWEVFEKVCSAFNGRIPSFSIMEDLSVAELALGVQLVSKLKRREFQDEVKAYVASDAFEEGYVLLPEPLDFAQEYLDKLLVGTPGESTRDKLAGLSDLHSYEVTDDTNPVHVQAGLLQAVRTYIKSRDTVEVRA